MPDASNAHYSLTTLQGIIQVYQDWYGHLKVSPQTQKNLTPIGICITKRKGY